MAIIGALDKTKHFSEFGDPLQSAKGVLTAAQRKALARTALGLATSAATGASADVTFTATTAAGLVADDVQEALVALANQKVSSAPASIATAGDGAYTAAHLVSGIIVRDCAGGSRTDTLADAADIVAALVNPKVGQVLTVHVVNGSDAAEAITLAVPASGSFDAHQEAGSRVIGQNTSKDIRIRLTNVTALAEAYVVYA